MVDAMLFIARTGCQWRYLPERYGAWTAVWAQWRRWRANGVWEQAMTRLTAIVRLRHDRDPAPSMVMVDAQTDRTRGRAVDAECRARGMRRSLCGPITHRHGWTSVRTGARDCLAGHTRGKRVDRGPPVRVQLGRRTPHQNGHGLPRGGSQRPFF